ncbi:MAG: methyltransferase [Candidatus Thorarchaeota archaeon]
MVEIKVTTFEDVKDLLRMNIVSAALGTAFELKLFEIINNHPQDARKIAETFDIPLDRVYWWLELLVGLGLLEQDSGTYSISPITRSAVFESYSAETWAQLAQYAREGYRIGDNLVFHISHPKSVWASQGLSPPDWFKQIQKDPTRARRFTYLLYELHLPLAKTLAQTLEMTGVRQMMDLGGGSGVMSLMLLEQHTSLKAVVVDIPNVCVVGREIADNTIVANRIEYRALDFIHDELPTGFDLILQCDAGIHTETFFQKLYNVLNKGGQLVIVDWWNRGITDSQPVPDTSLQRRMKQFESSLQVPRLPITTGTEVATNIKSRLFQVGFRDISLDTLEDETTIIRSKKPRQGVE